MLWLWLIVGIILFAGVGVVLLRWANQPMAYSGLLLADSERFLNGFLLQFSTGSVCFFDRESGPGFLQLAMVNVTVNSSKWNLECRIRNGPERSSI